MPRQVDPGPQPRRLQVVGKKTRWAKHLYTAPEMLISGCSRGNGSATTWLLQPEAKSRRIS